jgi:hypothetical protein
MKYVHADRCDDPRRAPVPPASPVLRTLFGQQAMTALARLYTSGSVGDDARLARRREALRRWRGLGNEPRGR